MLTKNISEKIREEFPVFKKYVYMNTGWCAPRSTRVLSAINEINEIESREGVGSQKIRKVQDSVRNSLRQKAAKFLGAGEDETAVTQNTSSGINMIVTCFTFKPGDEIIISSEEHPAGIVPWLQLKNLKGINLKVVKTGAPEVFIDNLKKALSKKTKLIMLSHVSCMTGFCLPIKEVCRIAREKEIPVLVDGAQSAGQIKVDVHGLGCDFYAIPGQKWMLGPESTGALYIRKEMLEKIQSINAGYRSIRKFAFEGPSMELFESAKRFEMFDTNAALMNGLDMGISILDETGIDEIEETIKNNARIITDEFSKMSGIKILTPSNYSKKPDSGLLSIIFTEMESADAVNELYEKYGIIARHFRTGNIVRFSLNYFNSENDISKVIEAVSQLSSKA